MRQRLQRAGIFVVTVLGVHGFSLKIGVKSAERNVILIMYGIPLFVIKETGQMKRQKLPNVNGYFRSPGERAEGYEA